MTQMDTVLPQIRFISSFNQMLKMPRQLLFIRRQISSDLDQIGCAVGHDLRLNRKMFDKGFELF